MPKYIALGAVTDPYQPIEREHRITRAVLEVLERASHPVGIVTKSALVVRDIDILARMAGRGLAKVAISVTTLDRRDRAQDGAAGRHAAAASGGHQGAERRRRAGRGHGRRPIIPAINDSEIERILAAAREAGASEAGYVLLRLPLELKELFREWLQTEFPDRAARAINILRSMHGGKDYTPEWGVRQRGSGPYAEQIGLPIPPGHEALGPQRARTRKLRTDLFQRPVGKGGQLSLL